MKRNFIILLFTFSSLLINSCSNGFKSDGSIIYTFEVLPKEISAESAVKQLNKRIEMFGIKDYKTEVISDNQIKVQLPYIDENNRLYRFLLTPAQLAFWETYSFTNPEIYTAVIKADSVSKILPTENPKDLDKKNKGLFSYLIPNFIQNKGNYFPGNGPIMGYVKIDDTAYINTIFSNPQIKKLFPKEMKLLWGAKPPKYLGSDNQNRSLELYILYDKYADNIATLPVFNVKDAAHNFSDNGSPNITFTLNEKEADEWKSLTLRNIGKSIAIVLDNKVFAAPQVMAEINGGRSQITGNFTHEEAADLANVLKAGRYNFTIKLISKERIKE